MEDGITLAAKTLYDNGGTRQISARAMRCDVLIECNTVIDVSG